MTVPLPQSVVRIRNRTRDAPATPVPAGQLVGDWHIGAVCLVWVPLVLWLDSRGGGESLTEQRSLGAATWLLLLALLWREDRLTRVQVAVVVAFATAVEYTFSPLLGVYIYRLHNVPAFVPPGHGLVYLCALCLGRIVLARHLTDVLAVAVALVGGAYAAWGLFGSGRLDVLGAFWFGCLLAFLRWGPSRPLYVGAFVVVTYLELMGTALHVWTWQSHDPTGLVAIGNPPSGAAGGYGWFDLAALLVAPLIVRLSRPAEAGGADHR